MNECFAPSVYSCELRLPAATPVISSCKFQFANARGPWVKCRIIVLDTAYHGQADSRVAVMCALGDKLLGATRDWPVRWRPWRCVSTPLDLDRMARILAAISRANLRHGFADGPGA